MRHTILCLVLAVLAAAGCFILLPIIGLLLLRIIFPGLFEDDTLTWVLIFTGPALLSLLTGLSAAAGILAFFFAKALLPDDGWRSTSSLTILITFAALLAAGAAATFLYFWEPPETGPQQTGLPELHLAQTLTTKDRLPSVWHLTWSSDDERIASYGGPGVITWSPNGRYQKKFPLYQNLPSGDVLHFLSDHRLLITSPLTENNDPEARAKLDDVAFSVVDAETGKVVRQISGPHPGGRGPDNEATSLAVSPDEHWAVAICGSAEPQINIFDTNNWERVAIIRGDADEKRRADSTRHLVFSPDSKVLAVVGLGTRINFFEVGSWTNSGTLLTYSDRLPGTLVDAIAFSPNGESIAIGSLGGGSWWVDHLNQPTRPGWGTLKQGWPPDPLRVYRVSDGKLLASLGSFPGGLWQGGLTWSPNGEYIAFRDARSAIRLWNPSRPGLSVRVARGETLSGHRLEFSKDGSQLAATFPDGVRVYNVVASK